MEMIKIYDIGPRVKNLRESLGLTQQQAAEKAGLSQGNYATIELGKRRHPQNIDKLAKALNTTPQYLLFGENEVMAKRHKIPLIDSVSAGKWMSVNEIDEYPMIYIDEEVPEGSFAMKVEGFSMYNPQHPKSIEDGSIIIACSNKEPNNNDVVVAFLEDMNEATIKMLVSEAGKKMLLH